MNDYKITLTWREDRQKWYLNGYIKVNHSEWDIDGATLVFDTLENAIESIKDLKRDQVVRK